MNENLIVQHYHELWKFLVSILMTIYVSDPVPACSPPPFFFSFLAFSLNVDDLLPFTTRGGSTHFALTYLKVFIVSKSHLYMFSKEYPFRKVMAGF